MDLKFWPKGTFWGLKYAGIFWGHEKHTGIFFGYCIFHQLKSVDKFCSWDFFGYKMNLCRPPPSPSPVIVVSEWVPGVLA